MGVSVSSSLGSVDTKEQEGRSGKGAVCWLLKGTVQSTFTEFLE